MNKSPRGPFSEEEVISLIQQKLVRPNDMALRVSGETKSNWNLLKTYSEFQNAFAGRVPKAVVTEPESVITPVVNIDDIPELKAEDLVPRTAKNAFEHRMEETAVEALQELPALKRDSPFGLLKRLSPLIGLFLLFFVGFEVFRSNTELPKDATEKEAVIPAFANITTPRPQMRIPTSLPKQAPAVKAVVEVTPAPPPPAPVVEKPDERSREEKTSELADRSSRSEDDRSGDDEEEEKPKKKKKAKKVVEDEESEGFDERDNAS